MIVITSLTGSINQYEWNQLDKNAFLYSSWQTWLCYSLSCPYRQEPLISLHRFIQCFFLLCNVCAIPDHPGVDIIFNFTSDYKKCQLWGWLEIAPANLWAWLYLICTCVHDRHNRSREVFHQVIIHHRQGYKDSVRLRALRYYTYKPRINDELLAWNKTRKLQAL